MQEDAEPLKLSSGAGESASRTGNLGGNFAVPYKVTHTPTVSIYPTEMEIMSHKTLRTHVYGSSLHHQQNCPSVSEWINRLWYIHTTEYCSATRGASYR